MSGQEVFVFEDETVAPTEDLRILFDAVCNSMDFGSGFLDTEEVEALRRLAGTLGVNPMVGTPSEFRTQYTHDFEAREAPEWVWVSGKMRTREEAPEEYAAQAAVTTVQCRHCGRIAGMKPHPQEEAGA